MIREFYKAVLCDVYEFRSNEIMSDEWESKHGNKILMLLTAKGISQEDILEVEYAEDFMSVRYFIRVGEVYINYGVEYQREYPMQVKQKVLISDLDSEPFEINGILYKENNQIEYLLNYMEIRNTITEELGV